MNIAKQKSFYIVGAVEERGDQVGEESRMRQTGNFMEALEQNGTIVGLSKEEDSYENLQRAWMVFSSAVQVFAFFCKLDFSPPNN